MALATPPHDLEPVSQSPRCGDARVRMLVLEGIAISVGLGTAVAAIGRLAMVLLLLWMLARRSALAVIDPTGGRGNWVLRWDWLALLTVAYMASTILWTSVDWASGLWAWSEHARLITIPVVFLLVRNRNEAQIVLRYFVFTQLFVVFSSWLLIADVTVPWALAEHAQRDYEVFGTYLEQSITEAVTAFILWHQRRWILGTQRNWLAVLVAWSIVVHIFGFLPSRTGYLVTAALLGVAVLAHAPRRWRVGGILLTGAVTLLALPMVMGSESVRAQLAPLSQKLTRPQEQRDRQISTDVRLVFWAASLKAMAEQPVFGSGSGSWNREYLRVTSVDIPTYRNIRDPHQMFLLWGVEGGAIGLCLLCATLLSLFATSRQFATADALSLQAILIALVVAGLTTSTIYGIGLGDFFCVGIGLLLRLGATAHSTTNGDSCDTA